jgi:N-succinyldiaminopimelate aminotransferase
MFNPKLAALKTYPFERKNQLFAGLSRSVAADLTIGEPQHAPDPRVAELLNEHAAAAISRYPKTRQESFLTEAIIEANRRAKRLCGDISSQQVLAGCGSGELLYSLPSVCIDPQKPYVLIPNPAYQVYQTATEFAGGIPYYFDLVAENGFQPDIESLPASVLARTSLCFINSPNNPCGVCYSEETLRRLVMLARTHGFVLASDECYSEIYFGERSLSILEVCSNLDGNTEFQNVVAFDSLSKRSSLPGLRSGSMIGDAALMREFLKLRMSERKVMPLHVQRASAFAWTNFEDVERNRKLYARKMELLARAFKEIDSPVTVPQGSFYCWLDVSDLHTDDQAFALELAQETGVLTFPGSFFAQESEKGNPGAGFLRIALIDSMERTEAALQTLTTFIAHKRSK